MVKVASSMEYILTCVFCDYATEWIVAQWMIRDHLWEDYSVQNVSTATRMRLAVDLVMKSHNEMAGDIVHKAVAHWQVEAK
ncbi:hypothetical protein HN51_043779 [Arachis hypogaea]